MRAVFMLLRLLILLVTIGVIDIGEPEDYGI